MFLFSLLRSVTTCVCSHLTWCFQNEVDVLGDLGWVWASCLGGSQQTVLPEPVLSCPARPPRLSECVFVCLISHMLLLSLSKWSKQTSGFVVAARWRYFHFLLSTHWRRHTHSNPQFHPVCLWRTFLFENGHLWVRQDHLGQTELTAAVCEHEKI